MPVGAVSPAFSDDAFSFTLALVNEKLTLSMNAFVRKGRFPLLNFYWRESTIIGFGFTLKGVTVLFFHASCWPLSLFSDILQSDMQNVLSEIEAAEKRIESSYQDLRNFAFSLCDSVMKTGTGSGIIIAPTLRSAVTSALAERTSAEEALKSRCSDIDTLESSKGRVTDLKGRLEQTDSRIREIKRVFGAIALERAEADDADDRLKAALRPYTDQLKLRAEKKNSSNVFIRFSAGVGDAVLKGRREREFVSAFDTLEKERLLRTVRSPRAEALLQEYQKLRKKEDSIRKRLKRRVSEVESLESNGQEDSVRALEERLRDAGNNYEEACINYGLFLFDNGQKWINEKTSDQVLDMISQMLQTQRYIDTQQEFIKKCRAHLVQDDYQAIISENEKKIASLRKEIGRIEQQIADIENENTLIRARIRKLGAEDE